MQSLKLQVKSENIWVPDYRKVLILLSIYLVLYLVNVFCGGIGVFDDFSNMRTEFVYGCGFFTKVIVSLQLGYLLKILGWVIILYLMYYFVYLAKKKLISKFK